MPTSAEREPSNKEWALYWRELDSGEVICVYRMTFGKARLCLGSADGLSILDGFCYESPARAIEAAAVWTGEGDPLDGWHRNPFTGRVREGGDAAKERVRW